MSFPPGPPLPMPGMPPVPPMLPPPYAVPPMGGMIPMTVGMMPAPMMAPVAMTMPAPIPMPQHQKMPMKKMNTQNTYKKPEHHPEQQPDLPKGPPVTVFVGNITDRAPDTLVRQILQRCGIVLNWKRVQGANGKLQAFGFCEYGDPESALRAMRLLHDYELGEKKLVVKVDGKTKEKLDEYKANKLAKLQDDGKESKDKEENNKEEGETTDDALDEMTKQRDNAIMTSLQSLIHAHAAELSKPIEEKEVSSPVITPLQPEKITPTENLSPKPRIDYERLKKNELDEMDLEEDKKSLIHREIDKFRDTYKRAEEEKEKDKDRRPRRRDYESPEPRSRDRDRDRDRDRERDRDRDRDKRWSKERSLGREERSSRRRRSRDRDHKSPRDSPVVSREHRERSRERQIERQRSGSRDRSEWTRERERSDDKAKDREYDKEDEDDAYERKKQERKIREKEAVYQERLRNWVVRERRKAKEYEKERIKAEEQKKDEAKEARRLKEFLEDYDDEKDDPKYFKGSYLVRRMKEREKEIEEDMLDRQREKEELDELRKKLVEEGHPNPEAEVERLLMEESRLMEPPRPETPESEREPPPVKMRPTSKAVSPSEEKEERNSKRPVLEDEVSQNSFSGFSDVTQQEEVKLMGFTSLRLGASPTQQHNANSTVPHANHASNKRKVTVDDVFNIKDEEAEAKKKRKLVLLDDNQEEGRKTPNSVSQMTMEEKRKHIKNLIEKIPTDKNELFAYNLDWSVVDKVLMEKRIRPWINKKIVEYIGEEEPTLVEFICSKIMAGSAAQSILDDVSMVLDDEAEVFVVKMWRLLIYEIEAKKLGLVCKPDGSSQMNRRVSKPTDNGRLPIDVLIEIFRFLKTDEMCRAGRVCKRWSEVLKEPSLWIKVDAEVKSSNEVAQLIKRLPRCVTYLRICCSTLDVHFPLWLSDVIAGLSKRCPDLEILIIEKVFFQVQPCDVQIRTLDENKFHTFAPIGSADEDELFCKSCASEDIDLDQFALEYLPKKLRVMSLKDSLFISSRIASRLDVLIPQLKVLDLSPCFCLSEDIIPLFSMLSNLTELYLGRCPVTTKGIEKLLQAAENLKILDLENTDVCYKKFVALKRYGQHLEELYVGGTLVTDSFLAFEDENTFDNLRVLCLRRTCVTPRGLVELLDLYSSICSVNVSQCDVEEIWTDERYFYMHEKLIFNNTVYCDHFRQNMHHK